MKRFKKHTEKTPLSDTLVRRFDRYIPAEDSQLAECIRWLLMLWRFGKVLCVAAGIVIIAWAAQIIDTSYADISPNFIKGVSTLTTYFLPFFLDLITTSFTYLWQPVLIYLLIILLTRSQIWRKFWCVVGVAGFLLIFVSTLEQSSWKEYRLLPLLLLQGYLFILWLLPRECWNVMGLVISSALGLVILILPDLPTSFDDFGMFGAILVFFLGYLNALASLIQRAGRWL